VLSGIKDPSGEYWQPCLLDGVEPPDASQQSIHQQNQRRFIMNQHPAVPGNLTLPHVAMCHDQLITTSLNLSAVFDKEHAKVMRNIKQFIEDQGEFAHANFGACSYTDLNNRERPMYEITRDGFTLLAMGFTGQKAMQFKIAYIEAFNAMESELHRQDDAHVNMALAEELGRARDQVNALKESLFDATSKLANMQARYIERIDAPAKPKRKAPRPITDAECVRIRKLAATGISNAQVARETGRSSASVSFILRGAVA